MSKKRDRPTRAPHAPRKTDREAPATRERPSADETPDRGDDSPSRAPARSDRAARLLSLQARYGNARVQQILRTTAPSEPDASTADRVQPPAPNIGPGSRIVIEGDVGRIVSTLQSQWLTAEDEREIVEIIAKWSRADDEWEAKTSYQGTDHLDLLLLLLKTRAYTRKTVRTAWVDHTSSPFDDLYHDLEGDRLAAFAAIVSKSKTQSESGPLGEEAENIWATLGKEEAIGLFGILKGMGTGAAKLTDSGAWAVTKAMRAAGLDVEEPASAADWLAEQYDITGEAFFGGDWTEGEDLLGGLSAADIGTGGGKIIWSLTMAGAGAQAEAAGAAGTTEMLKTFSFLGNLKGVETAGQQIADRLLVMAGEGELSAGAVLSDAQLWQAATSLASSAFGAVGFAQTDEGEVAEALQEQLKSIGVLLDVAEIAAAIGRLVEIGASDKDPDEKEEAASKVIMEDIIQKQGGMLAGALKDEQQK